MAYDPLMVVKHTRDDSVVNTVREEHDTLTDKDAITIDRVRTVIRRIMNNPEFANDVILLVGHYATVKIAAAMFDEETPLALRIQGDRSVSCFAEYRPSHGDPAGPWMSVTGHWGTGAIHKHMMRLPR